MSLQHQKLSFPIAAVQRPGASALTVPTHHQTQKTVDVSVSVVTYNCAHCLGPLLESLAAQEGVRCEHLFLDNASIDGTQTLLRERALGPTTFLSRNTGFSRGHNSLLQRCTGRYVLVLNPDVEFASDLVARLASFLDQHPEYSLVGPTIVQADKTLPVREYYPFEDKLPLERGFDSAGIAWLSGACFMIRREVAQRLEGFDEDYFLYYEDPDLCLRARRSGFRIAHCSDAVVFHAGQQSQIDDSPFQIAYRSGRSGLEFLEKHYAYQYVERLVVSRWWKAKVIRFVEPLLRLVQNNRRAECDARIASHRAWACLSSEWLKNHRVNLLVRLYQLIPLLLVRIQRWATSLLSNLLLGDRKASGQIVHSPSSE